MKNFKGYEQYLFEFRDKWAGGQATKASVDAIGGIYNFISIKVKVLKLKKLANEYDRYLEKVFQAYMNRRSVTQSATTPTPTPTPTPTATATPATATPAVNVTQAELSNNTHKIANQINDLLHDVPNTTDPEYPAWIDKGKLIRVELKKAKQDAEDIETNSLITDAPSFNSLKSDINDYHQELTNFGIPESKVSHFKSKEDNSYLEGAIEAPSDWSEKDKSALDLLVNPYRIKSIELRATGYTTVDNSNKSAKLKARWEQLSTDVHKKWNYIFNIDKLKTQKVIPGNSNSKENKNNTKELENEGKLDSLKDIFAINTVHLSKIKDNNYYVLNLVDTNNFYLLHISRTSDMYFKVVGELIYSTKESKVDNIKWFLSSAKITSLDVDGKVYDIKLDGDDGYGCFKIENGVADISMIIQFESNKKSNEMKIDKDYMFYGIESSSADKLITEASKRVPSAPSQTVINKIS
jgi:hypothetical protein